MTMSRDPVPAALRALTQKVAELQRLYERLKNVETGFPFVPLTTPLTSTSYDGNDTIAVGTTTIDTSAVFGAPDGIKAAAVYIEGAWAAAAAGSFASVEPVGSGLRMVVIRAQTLFFQNEWGVVPCNANGDFDLRVAGVQVLTFSMRITGYWR